MSKTDNGKIGFWAVVAIGVGFAGIKTAQIAPGSWSPPLQLAAGGNDCVGNNYRRKLPADETGDQIT